MHKRLFSRAATGVMLLAALFFVFLSPPGETIHAFNQSNLIRVSEIREVDGKIFYRRVAPVSDFLP
ncbi:MAG: hypothetical protein GX200_04880 [Firmicutes bacterium]|nr:hypothetical protein [Bacillota bacterium]